MPVITRSIEQEQTPFSPLDIHFAELMEKYCGGSNEPVRLAAALVSYFRGRGHTCVHLPTFCQAPFLPDTSVRIECPSLHAWTIHLRESPVVGTPGQFRPLILDASGRLYLQRYWRYESDLAHSIRQRLGTIPVDEGILRDGLARLFNSDTRPDWQKVAAFTALTHPFTIISGGPGTGKTSTVLKILALLLEQRSSMRIVLTAPTGKAASRLQESIKAAKPNLNCPDEIKAAIPETASTIHRLLRMTPDLSRFRHNARNQLALDVIVIDEASMVDLALMTKLLAAVPASARVILLGDKDQLSSVEAGAVLGDICSAGTPETFSKTFCDAYARVTGESLPAGGSHAEGTPLDDCIVQLQKNYRFGDDSPIHRASLAIRSGDFDSLKALLSAGHADLEWYPSLRNGDAFHQRVLEGYRAFLESNTAGQALSCLNQFRVLAALRDSDFGVTELNRRIEKILMGHGLINPSETWYQGRPVMITRNDYTLNVFNGDTGVVRHDRETGQLRAFFQGTDQQVRSILPSRLPEHQTVYAMTIHKSQGSEFDHVVIVLPDYENPILTQELLYTALTRARKRVTIFASESALRLSVTRRVKRVSGLAEGLVR